VADDGEQLPLPRLPTVHPDVREWDFPRWFGPSTPLRPAAVARLLAGTGVTWWVVGGWSLEADPAHPRRHHDDIDVAVRSDQADAVREALSGFHLWQTYPGLRPVYPGEPLPEGLDQMWVRRDAFSPWLMDLLLTPVDGADWVYKKDHRVRLPLTEVVRTGPDGLPYQAPHVGLLFKAKHARVKDAGDLDDCWQRLAVPDRRWFLETLALTDPGHPWLDRVSVLG
jgi:hypothetical protein